MKALVDDCNAFFAASLSNSVVLLSERDRGLGSLLSERDRGLGSLLSGRDRGLGSLLSVRARGLTDGLTTGLQGRLSEALFELDRIFRVFSESEGIQIPDFFVEMSFFFVTGCSTATMCCVRVTL